MRAALYSFSLVLLGVDVRPICVLSGVRFTANRRATVRKRIIHMSLDECDLLADFTRSTLSAVVIAVSARLSETFWLNIWALTGGSEATRR